MPMRTPAENAEATCRLGALGSRRVGDAAQTDDGPQYDDRIDGLAERIRAHPNEWWIRCRQPCGPDGGLLRGVPPRDHRDEPHGECPCKCLCDFQGGWNFARHLRPRKTGRDERNEQRIAGHTTDTRALSFISVDEPVAARQAARKEQVLVFVLRHRLVHPVAETECQTKCEGHQDRRAQ